MDPLLQWYNQMPVVSKTYLTGIFLTSLCVHLDIINPLMLYLNFGAVWKGQVWRLLSTFFFFDYFGLNFIFSLIFLVPHVTALERNFYRGRTGDFVWLFVLAMTALLAIDWVLLTYRIAKVMFLGPALSFSIVYIWSRRNPNVQMSLLGVFNFSAPYLPVVIIGIGVLLGHDPIYDLMGVAVGHTYWYLEDVYPEIRPGRKLLPTPSIVRHIFDTRGD